MEEKILKKLARTNILMNFVKKNDGNWDHQAWLNLCANLEKKELYPNRL